MAAIVAVCRSDAKGTRKLPVESGVFEIGTGLMGDAHARCNPVREVSFLALESINKMNKSGFSFKPGDFAENLTTQGIELPSMPVGTRFQVGESVIFELTQIGKKCHTECAIFKEVGNCIMPKEGVFARVVQGGVVKAGDAIKII